LRQIRIIFRAEQLFLPRAAGDQDIPILQRIGHYGYIGLYDQLCKYEAVQKYQEMEQRECSHAARCSFDEGDAGLVTRCNAVDQAQDNGIVPMVRICSPLGFGIIGVYILLQVGSLRWIPHFIPLSWIDIPHIGTWRRNYCGIKPRLYQCRRDISFKL